MISLVVSGDFGKVPKPSKIAQQLAKELKANIINGGTYHDLQEAAKVVNKYDLVIWMPNIDNGYQDVTFTKKTGAVVVVSKRLRDNRTRGDAVSRIFKYHGNAVIAISEEHSAFTFELIDALNNTWSKSTNIRKIGEKIKELQKWTSESVRVPSIRTKDNMDTLLDITHRIADDVQEIQGRFFGNISTRCSALFPSMKEQYSFYVSARDTDKKKLQRTEMVQCKKHKTKDAIIFTGTKKPSVDSPIQLEIYKEFPWINYMIHGHNFIKGAKFTKDYFPCGDKREIPEITEAIKNTENYSKRTGRAGSINLLNHGFLIYAEDLESLRKITDNIEFEEI